MPVRNPKPSISASRAQVLRGEKAIGWLLKNKKTLPATSSAQVVQAAFAVELQSRKPGLIFFFQVSKRDVPESHDRQKIKRWLREALRRAEALPEVSKLATASRKRMHLVLRVRKSPGLGVNWKPILSDVSAIAEALLVRLTPTPGLVLVKRESVDQEMEEEPKNA